MSWGGRRVEKIRAHWGDVILARWVAGDPVECGALICLLPSRAIGPGSSWDVGHGTARSDDPARTWDPTNHHPEHARCNRADGARRTNTRHSRNRQRSWL